MELMSSSFPFFGVFNGIPSSARCDRIRCFIQFRSFILHMANPIVSQRWIDRLAFVITFLAPSWLDPWRTFAGKSAMAITLCEYRLLANFICGVSCEIRHHSVIQPCRRQFRVDVVGICSMPPLRTIESTLNVQVAAQCVAMAVAVRYGVIDQRIHNLIRTIDRRQAVSFDFVRAQKEFNLVFVRAIKMFLPATDIERRRNKNPHSISVDCTDQHDEWIHLKNDRK